jgi:hypothetical protein
MSDLRHARTYRGTLTGWKSPRLSPESPLLYGENQGENCFAAALEAKRGSLIKHLDAGCRVNPCQEQGGFDDLLTKSGPRKRNVEKPLISGRS